jgi:hypothetical protein
MEDERAHASIRDGERFEALADVEVRIAVVRKAPMSATSLPAVLPAGTVLIAHELPEGATVLTCHPAEYERMEQHLIPPEIPEADWYGRYGVWVRVEALRSSFRRLPPAPIPPRNRLPDR